ncbi:MAG: HEAT repeat domain-containing protein [Gammaproteobacteria bacterium]|nr:HEAT repeat domain-containing protein [Gammaproteobacteria bacterium]
MEVRAVITAVIAAAITLTGCGGDHTASSTAERDGATHDSDMTEVAATLVHHERQDALSLSDTSAMNDHRSAVRIDAVETLATLRGTAAVDALSLALADPDHSVREAAIEALSDIATDDAARALGIALADTDDELREAAVDALAEIGGETAVDLLHQAATDGNLRIRELARDYLEEFDAP